jgi:UDP-N-acetylglucosamine 2-epimerase
MLKVMTIVGTRPELIKMSRVIAEFDIHTQHVLVHTGQNFDYELNQVFFDDLDIRKPDYFLGAVGSNAAQTIARVIEKADEVMEAEKPDALMATLTPAWLSSLPSAGKFRCSIWKPAIVASTSAFQRN